MQIKCGADLVSIERIAKAIKRLGDPFLQRLWTKAEIDYCLPQGQWHPGTAASLAARFAAKEAMAKALGTGIGRQGISWLDLQVICDPMGRPEAVLANAARQVYEQMGGKSIALSLSHESGLAQAFCVIIHDQAIAGDESNVV